MSLIRHGFLPRSMYEMDNWFRPTLDVFDPFDDFDRMLCKNLEWLTVPTFMQPLVQHRPKIPNKYRITVDCHGYNPKSLKTEFKDGKLVVSGREEQRHDESGDYSTKEFKKSFKLPENAEHEKLASFVAGHHLVIEVPLKLEEQAESEEEEDLFPRVIEKDGKKSIKMKCDVPKGIDPAKLSVTCKDRDLIIKAEDKQENPDHYSQVYYYKRCTLPENTDFNALKCLFENNKLSIEAPIVPALASNQRQIPIEGNINKKN